MIDKWNGQVYKDNVTIKATAFESMFQSMFGAPVSVVRGFIKKLRIDVPWNKLLSKPCEIYLDDVHIVLKSPTKFDKEWAKRMIWNVKHTSFNELLEQVRKQQALKELSSEEAKITVTEKET